MRSCFAGGRVYRVATSRVLCSSFGNYRRDFHRAGWGISLTSAVLGVQEYDSRRRDKVSASGLLNLLKSSLQILASDPPDQVAYTRRLGVGIDELALEFDDVGPARPTLMDAGLLTSDQSDAVAAVDRQLTSMTRAGAARWTDRAVFEGEDWKRTASTSTKCVSKIEMILN